MIIARRLNFRPPFGAIFPNLFSLCVARSSVYAKTTGLNILRHIAHRDFPHLLLPHDSTMEALLSELAGREPEKLESLEPAEQEAWRAGRHFAAQRSLVLDEFTGLLATARKDYGAGTKETLLRLYDCDGTYTRNTRGQGRVTVRNAYLNILSATARVRWRPTWVWNSSGRCGLWPRCTILTPEVEPNNGNPQDCDELTIIRETLDALAARLPTSEWPDPAEAKTVVLRADAHAVWESYDEAMFHFAAKQAVAARLEPLYMRLPTQAMKVAIILAAFDWSDSSNVPVIEVHHMHRALVTAERWRRSAHRAVRDTGLSRYQSERERVLRVIRRKQPAGGASIHDLNRSLTDMEPKVLEETPAVLTAEQTITEAPPAKGRGRPTVRYVEVAE